MSYLAQEHTCRHARDYTHSHWNRQEGTLLRYTNNNNLYQQLSVLKLYVMQRCADQR